MALNDAHFNRQTIFKQILFPALKFLPGTVRSVAKIIYFALNLTKRHKYIDRKMLKSKILSKFVRISNREWKQKTNT